MRRVGCFCGPSLARVQALGCWFAWVGLVVPVHAAPPGAAPAAKSSVPASASAAESPAQPEGSPAEKTEPPAPDIEAPDSDLPTETATESMEAESTELDAEVAAALAAATGASEETLAARRTVAYLATAVALVAAGTGVGIGYLAEQQYRCLGDVLTCNRDRATPIEGSAYLDEIAAMEQKAVAADMMFVLAGASGLVAATNWYRGFVFTGEEPERDATPSPPASPGAASGQGAQ